MAAGPPETGFGKTRSVARRGRSLSAHRFAEIRNPNSVAEPEHVAWPRSRPNVRAALDHAAHPFNSNPTAEHGAGGIRDAALDDVH